MRLSSTPACNLASFWAKSTGESIGTHTLRVLQNLRQLRDRTPRLDGISGSPSFWPRAALAVCLHDLGKCCDGFQAVVHEQKRFHHRHEVLSAIFVPWILSGSAEDAKWVAAAVLTHHRDWPEIDRLYPPAEYDSADGIEALLPQISHEFFSIAERIAREEVWPELLRSWPIPKAWAASACLEWIPKEPVRELRSTLEMARAVMHYGGHQRNALESIEGTLLRGAVILSDHSGSAWEDLRVLQGLEDPERTRNQIGIPTVDDLYPHQVQISTDTGNSILIAPTGSGKTEAALLWSSRQNTPATGQPIIYYLLPYQASLNAMRQRLAKMFGDEPIALQHSRAVQALYRQLLDKQYTSKDAERVAKQERNLASLYVKPLRVSTPYQLLKGAFQLRGHEALWTAAANALFIVDEIHVYETTRLAILLALFRYLCTNLDGRMLVMSATLPTYLLNIIKGLLPSVSVVRANSSTLKKFRRHELCLLDENLLNEKTIEDICADAHAGMGVLVVTTTVGRAQEIWAELQQRAKCDLELLHGRFHADDRAAKEARLHATRGVGGSMPRSGVILVATQVIEVSLNVDFDVLYSDPAPLEALLQRFGRVNRERQHPLRTVKVCRDIPEGSPVYPESLVRKALCALELWDGKAIEEDQTQAMLDGVYDEKLGPLLSSEIKAGIQRFSDDVLATCYPFASDERIESLFEEMFEGYEVLPSQLKDEYELRQEQTPFLAPGLLIPVTKGQYFSLKSRGRLRPHRTTGMNVMLADCPYSERGLEVYGPAREDGI